MTGTKFTGCFLLSVVIIFAIVGGCTVVKLDQSIHDIRDGNNAAALVSLKKELSELEKKEAKLSRSRNYQDRYYNVSKRWTKIKLIALMNMSQGRYQETIPLCQRYIEKYPADLQIVKDYVSWYVRKFGPMPQPNLPSPTELLYRGLLQQYEDIAKAYAAMNDYDRANHYAVKAMKGHQRVPLRLHTITAGAYPPLLDIFINSGDMEHTEEMIGLIKAYYAYLKRHPTRSVQAYGLGPHAKNPYLSSMAVYHFHKGNYRQAEQYQRELLRSIDSLWKQWQAHKVIGKFFKTKGDVTVDGQLFIAKCMVKQNRLNEAEDILRDYYRMLTEWHTDMREGPQTWESDKLFGDIQLKRGRTDQAIVYYARAADKIERIRAQLHQSRYKILYASAREQLYDTLVTCLAEKGDFVAAFEYSERSRARAFLDLLADRSLPVRDPAAGVLAQQRQAVLSALADTQNQLTLKSSAEKPAIVRSIAVKEKQLVQIENKISNQYPELASTLAVNLMPLEAIQASLAPGTHLIEYYLSDRKTIAWVLGHDSFRGFILPVTKTEVQDLVHDLRRNIHSPAMQQLESAASTLYGHLIEPLQPELRRGSRICIVSHGVLHHLPFQILKGGDNYLVQDYTLFYSPSANIYHICKQKRTAKGLTMLAMGDPDLNDPTLALPFARKEVKAIQSGFPTAEVYLGRQASKATFLDRAPGFKLIHLAAHGAFNTINPMRSGLLLAGANQDTRLLSAEEVFNCRLNAYLVTLSACKTALGKTTGGDELISVTRAFLYAGTPSVVSTLWNVDDEATAHLMISYYDKLRRMDKASALRLAQIETMKAYPNPFYWGAFILNGDWL